MPDHDTVAGRGAGGSLASQSPFLQLGAFGGSLDCGEQRLQTFDDSLELESLIGAGGFQIDAPIVDANGDGFADVTDFGMSVSGIGGVNGDGFDDIMIGAPNIGFGGNASGVSYVVCGGGFLDLTDLNATAHYAQISGIEQIDMTDGIASELTFDPIDLMHMSDGNHEFFIHGR